VIVFYSLFQMTDIPMLLIYRKHVNKSLRWDIIMEFQRSVLLYYYDLLSPSDQWLNFFKHESHRIIQLCLGWEYLARDVRHRILCDHLFNIILHIQLLKTRQTTMWVVSIMNRMVCLSNIGFLVLGLDWANFVSIHHISVSGW